MVLSGPVLVKGPHPSLVAKIHWGQSFFIHLTQQTQDEVYDSCWYLGYSSFHWELLNALYDYLQAISPLPVVSVWMSWRTLNLELSASVMKWTCFNVYLFGSSRIKQLWPPWSSSNLHVNFLALCPLCFYRVLHYSGIVTLVVLTTSYRKIEAMAFGASP